MSREIIFLVCASLAITICVKAGPQNDEIGSGSGSDSNLSLIISGVTVEDVAETAIISVDSMLALENTQDLVISQSQSNTSTPAQFVTSLVPEMMTTMVKTTPIPSVTGTMSYLQTIMATTSASTVVLPASLPLPTETGSLKDRMTGLSLLHILVFSTSQRSVSAIPSATIVPTTGAEGDTTTSKDGLGTSEKLSTSSILLIVLGIILFLIILFLAIIGLLVGLLRKHSKGN